MPSSNEAQAIRGKEILSTEERRRMKTPDYYRDLNTALLRGDFSMTTKMTREKALERMHYYEDLAQKRESDPKIKPS